MSIIHNDDNGINLVMQMIQDGIVVKSDLVNYLQNSKTITLPGKVRDEMEAWYKNMGIETLTGKPFRLKVPYFTEEEIKELDDRGEVLLCLPGNIDAVTLGRMFHMDSWAFHDPLVTLKTEQDDFWFSMKKSFEPEYLNQTPQKIAKRYKDEDKLNLSIERYMVFMARIKYLTGQYPDTSFKTWLPNTRYEKKGMLIGGMDSRSLFCVHAWMPNFNSPKVGGRFLFIVDHH